MLYSWHSAANRQQTFTLVSYKAALSAIAGPSRVESADVKAGHSTGSKKLRVQQCPAHKMGLSLLLKEASPPPLLLLLQVVTGALWKPPRGNKKISPKQHQRAVSWGVLGVYNGARGRAPFWVFEVVGEVHLSARDVNICVALTIELQAKALFGCSQNHLDCVGDDEVPQRSASSCVFYIDMPSKKASGK